MSSSPIQRLMSAVLLFLLLATFVCAENPRSVNEKRSGLVRKSQSSPGDSEKLPISGANSLTSTVALFGALIAAAIFTI